MRSRKKFTIFASLFLWCLFMRSVAYANPEIPNVTVQALAKAFDDNGPGAERKFNGKRVRITAKVHAIRENISNEVYIVLENPTSSSTGVACNFPYSEQQKIYDLRKGESVTVEGVINGMVWNVQLIECKFINIE
jgi:hypothetical protein